MKEDLRKLLELIELWMFWLENIHEGFRLLLKPSSPACGVSADREVISVPYDDGAFKLWSDGAQWTLNYVREGVQVWRLRWENAAGFAERLTQSQAYALLRPLHELFLAQGSRYREYWEQQRDAGQAFWGAPPGSALSLYGWASGPRLVRTLTRAQAYEDLGRLRGGSYDLFHTKAFKEVPPRIQAELTTPLQGDAQLLVTVEGFSVFQDGVHSEPKALTLEHLHGMLTLIRNIPDATQQCQDALAAQLHEVQDFARRLNHG